MVGLKSFVMDSQWLSYGGGSMFTETNRLYIREPLDLGIETGAP